MLAVGVAFFAVLKVVWEGAERKDETCKLFERQEAVAVHRLRQTYDFLEHPPESLKGLVPAILAQLRTTEEDARATKAPHYCDESGVGLPEPEHPSPFPKRPPNLPSP